MGDGPRKSLAAIVNGDKLIGQTELGWGLAEAAFSKDGTSAYVLTTGYESNKPAERRESELIRLDATTGQIAGRIAFDVEGMKRMTTFLGGSKGERFGLRTENEATRSPCMVVSPEKTARVRPRSELSGGTSAA